MKKPKLNLFEFVNSQLQTCGKGSTERSCEVVHPSVGRAVWYKRHQSMGGQPGLSDRVQAGQQVC